MEGHPVILRLTLVIALFLPAALEARAQNDVVQAHVRRVTGVARMYSNSRSAAFALKRNVRLEPGNIIETDLNGRVVISLSDGGQITVLPNSRVVLKNFLVPHSARELLDIVVGRVLVKIRSLAGKPNPYNLTSPAASIAVRGTEFIVDVLLNGETVVVVWEGEVEVWPRNNPANKRLVTPGRRVIVRPGGDISSAFPGPGSELKGRSRFYGSLEDDYQRSVESVAQNSNEVSPVFYSAFADPHFDSLENPAYAAEFKNAEGRLLLRPSFSAPYRLFVEGDSSSEGPPSFDYSVSPQLTFYSPIPGSRLVVGGGASALRTRLQDLTDFQFPDYKYYDSKTLRLNAFNVSLIAAYSLGKRGKTSAGISIDRFSGDGNFFSDFRIKDDRFNDEYIGNSNARFARTSLTFGLVHRFTESKKIGLYYRQGVSSSDQKTWYQYKFDDQYNPSPFPSNKTNISTISSELGARFRAPLTKRLYYGVEGSFLHERIRSRQEKRNQLTAQNRYSARRARIGGGMGFFLTSKILLNVDSAGGVFYDTEPVENIFIADIFGLATLARAPRSSRGEFVSTHAAVQTNVWRNLFFSASNLTTLRKEFISYTYNGLGYGYKNTYNARLTNAGIGWNFKPNLGAEYLFSIDHNRGVPSHSFNLRYNFSLSITGEK